MKNTEEERKERKKNKKEKKKPVVLKAKLVPPSITVPN